MTKKTAVTLGIIIVVLAVAIVGLGFLRDFQQNRFVWQYAVTDDTQWKTMVNDGGSNTNVYYQINFDDLQVRKCEDKYSAALKRYEYREKVLYQSTIDERTATKLKSILDKYWQTGDDTEGTYDYYIIEKDTDGKRYIHSREVISQIQAYLDKLDKNSTTAVTD